MDLKFDRACASTSWQAVTADSALPDYRVLSENKENLESNFFTAQRYVVKELASILKYNKTVLASGTEALSVQDVLKRITEEL